jgi:DNA-binding NtrC family response regulator
MNEERILISTHDLPKAGELRRAFKALGYQTDLVTADERLTDDPATALLVLTGGVQQGGGKLAIQARDQLHVPVFAIASEDGLPPALRPGFDEVFGHSTSVEDIVLLGHRLVERGKLRRLIGIVGETDAMQQVLERVVQIAPVASTVLITGESGTGKELVARGIHALSPRRHKPFIAVNVAALSETLLESELFGHEKGAFTGAIYSRRGLFELSHGGTIFLDEIGEMPLQTQTKLLRVLEQREFHRVGGEQSIKVDVRIVTATNQDLRQLIAIGEFRRDLFFRLNILSIELPALRERRDDIPLLVDSFVREVSQTHDMDFPGISAEAMEILSTYAWPGNVRELRNLVESMVVLAPGRVIRPEDIPSDLRSGRGASLLPATLPRAAVSQAAAERGGDLRPELEFVFRTLVELRVDMDDLKREFEAYRRGEGIEFAEGAILGRVRPGGAPEADIEIAPYSPREELVKDVEHAQVDTMESQNLVVFRPGMTMEELESQAIEAALNEVGGNRRKAADLLGIGERTLYRKISKYELES